MKAQRFFPAIGVAIFIYILWNMDLQKIYSSLQSIDIFILSLAASMVVPIVILKALRWNILSRSCGIKQPFWESVSGWLVGFAIGMVTPGRLGDLSRAYYLKKYTNLGKALTTVVVDRVIDVIILFLLTITGLSFLLATYTIGDMLLPLVVIFATAMVLVIVFTRKGFVSRILKPFFVRLVPEKYRPRLGSLFGNFYEGIGMMKKRYRLVALSTIIGFLTWALSIFQYYLIALSMGLGLTYWFLFMIAPLTILLDALPISFSGLGTRDALMIYFLALVGIAAEPAVAFSIIILIVGYMILGLAGMVIWSRTPITKNRKQ